MLYSFGSISHTNMWRLSCFHSLGETGYCNLEMDSLYESQSVVLQIFYYETVPSQIRRKSIIHTFEFWRLHQAGHFNKQNSTVTMNKAMRELLINNPRLKVIGIVCVTSAARTKSWYSCLCINNPATLGWERHPRTLWYERIWFHNLNSPPSLQSLL